tara:strand:+ start:2441 stop:3214 length:774 start_codon:yes stop_codon:yes gene_type:complete
MKKDENLSLQKPNNTFAVLLGLLLLVTTLVSVIFLTNPQFDIYIASFFYDEGNSFPLNNNQFLIQLRLFFNIEIGILCAGSLLMMIFARINKNMIIPAKLWDFMLVSFLIGPLLLANVIFKSNWGRARPANIEEFGGTLTFSPAYYISDQCSLNCSFVSGEGSAIATAGILLGIIAWNIFPKHRSVSIGLIGIISIIGISLRIVKGRHFISDSLLATLFCAIVILLLYHFAKITKIKHKLTLTNLCHDFKNMFNFKT